MESRKWKRCLWEIGLDLSHVLVTIGVVDCLPFFYFIIYRPDAIFLPPCFFLLYILLLLFYRCCLCVEIQEKKTYTVHRPKVPWTWFLFFFPFFFLDFIFLFLIYLIILLPVFRISILLFYFQMICRVPPRFPQLAPDGPSCPQLPPVAPRCPQIWTEKLSPGVLRRGFTR